MSKTIEQQVEEWFTGTFTLKEGEHELEGKKRFFGDILQERDRIAREEEREEKHLEFAIQQLTGWAECKYGTGNIEDLLISMGLTLEEWNMLEKRNEVEWLNDNTKVDIRKALTTPLEDNN